MTEVPPTSSRGSRPGVPGADDPLLKYDARILDPSTAVRVPDAPPPKPTVYRNNRLLINAKDAEELRQITAAIDRVLDEMHGGADDVRPFTPRFRRRNTGPLNPTRTSTGQPPGESAREPIEEPSPAEGRPETEPEWLDQAIRLRRAAAVGAPLAVVVLLEPDNAPLAPPTSPIDVFDVVQRLWTRARRDKWTLGFQVGLEHLLSVSIGLAPFGASLSPFGASLSPFGASLQSAGIPLNRSAAGGILSYLNPGTGGRAPVSLVLNLPDDKADGPRVVVLDTGCDATHAWFSDDHIVRRVAVVDDAGTVVKSGDGVHDLTIGIDVTVPANQETDPEGAACAPDEMTGAVKPCVGHGTFIAGVLRQKAPSAQIVALRIADADGIVPEGALTAAISEVIVKQGQELTKSSGTTGWADALVLSLGYYPEMDGATEADILEHSALGAQLPYLAELGVAIFAAAGNDATTREFFPAAFAVDPPFLNETAGALTRIPLVSVAAQNPDGTIALFSNDGSWVTAQAHGANVVSTFPRLMCGAWQPDVSLTGPARRVRATIDPDQYSGGFGVWSGTSFAAPVLAGDYLADLARQGARQGQSELDERRTLIRALVRPEHRSPERPVPESIADEPGDHGPS